MLGSETTKPPVKAAPKVFQLRLLTCAERVGMLDVRNTSGCDSTTSTKMVQYGSIPIAQDFADQPGRVTVAEWPVVRTTRIGIETAQRPVVIAGRIPHKAMAGLTALHGPDRNSLPERPGCFRLANAKLEQQHGFTTKNLPHLGWNMDDRTP
jgi:hypothetical protein